MLKSMVTGGLIAGCAAGVTAALMHFAFLQDLILEGERYESGEITHFADVGSGGTAPAQHSHMTPAEPAPAPAEAAPEEGHDHEHAATDPGAARDGLTVLFYVLTYCGFALVAAGAMAVARSRGHAPGMAEGLLWGVAGFVIVQMAPALGLPPELPGTPAANFDDRQMWWLMTVGLTALGLGLMAFGPNLVSRLAGVALLALPHIVGAPHLDGFAGVAPPELASAFAARSLAAGLVAWTVLGGVLARVQRA